MMNASVWDAVGDSEIQGYGAKLKPGVYKVQIERCSCIVSQNPETRGNNIAIAEVRVLESSNPLCPPGGLYSNTENLSRPYGPGNVKLFISAVMGINKDDAATLEKFKDAIKTVCAASYDGRNLLGMVSPSQPGLVVSVDVVEKQGKTSGRTYTQLVWFPAPGVPPQMAEIGARLGQFPNPVALPPQQPQQHMQPAPQGYGPPQGFPGQQPAPMHNHWQNAPQMQQHQPQPMMQQHQPQPTMQQQQQPMHPPPGVYNYTMPQQAAPPPMAPGQWSPAPPVPQGGPPPPPMPMGAPQGGPPGWPQR